MAQDVEWDEKFIGKECETCRVNTRVFRIDERQKYQIYEG